MQRRACRQRDWAALAARHRRWGASSASRDRHRRHRSRRRGSAPARLARRGPPRRDGLYGAARRRRARPGRARAGHARVITARMDYWPAGARSAERRSWPIARKAFVSRYALGRDYHKVLRAQARSSSPSASPRRRRRSATACSPTARRCSKSRWPRRRPRLARQAHAAADARGGLVFLPGRDLHRPAAAGDAAAIDALRHLHALHRRLPDRRDRRALRARRAALHLVPDDRARRQHPRGVAAADRQPRLRLRRLPARCPGTGSRSDAAKPDFDAVRNGLDDADLVELFAWTEGGVRRAACEGSAIRRIGYERWLRNLAVGLGNAPREPDVVAALARRADDPSPLVREHVAWALARHARELHDRRGPHAIGRPDPPVHGRTATRVG